MPCEVQGCLLKSLFDDLQIYIDSQQKSSKSSHLRGKSLVFLAMQHGSRDGSVGQSTTLVQSDISQQLLYGLT